MAISNFIPELWSARLLVSLQKSQVAASLVNRDYEGEIKKAGDTVHITNLTDPTVGAYTPHTPITVEDIDDATTALVIDQKNYFAFEVDDVEAAQQAGDSLGAQVDKAAYKLRDLADVYLLNAMQDAAQGTSNDIGTVDVSGTGGNDLVWEAIVDLGVRLDVSNVPSEGRFIVVSPALHGRLLKDSRFVAAGDAVGAATRGSGFIGQVAGLDIYKSNNMPAVVDAAATAGTAIAGYRGATTFAEQIVKVEASRMEKQFADMVKGLHVWGAKVVRPSGLAVVEFDGTAA